MVKTTDNTMVTRTNYDLQNTTQTTDNTMVTRTNYDLQNTTQKTKEQNELHKN